MSKSCGRAVVSDLESLTVDGFHEVEVVSAANAAENNVGGIQGGGDGAALAGRFHFT
tara:strand:+ start:946 stop:1116 length:171 start_codon:yes stop_codon:yes gene_type:complete